MKANFKPGINYHWKSEVIRNIKPIDLFYWRTQVSLIREFSKSMSLKKCAALT